MVGSPEHDQHDRLSGVGAEYQGLRERGGPGAMLGKALDRVSSLSASDLEAMVGAAGLPDRSIGPLFNASLGLRLRNRAYRTDAAVSEQVASRDLRLLVESGMLEPLGERRGRYYVRSQRLVELDQLIRRRRPARSTDDPFSLAKEAVEQQRIWPRDAAT